MTLATGSLLAGRYEITAPIAVGGMGEVWKARDRVLDRTVAAKVLKSEYTDDPSFLARFRNEARHTAALSHPNIASVYDYGETVDDTGTKKLAFLVMEFVEGQPLVQILHDEGKLPVDWTLHVLEQSAEGLSAAHRAGVVHRDIKPGNLMVRPDGVVKLTDFGIAQARDATPLTRTGMVVGTAQYLSPEQAQGMEVNAASDVYSLGVVAYECLTGGRPFDGTSQVAIALAHINRPPPPLPASVPPAVRLLVERALAKDPADRFPDGGAFAEAIRRVAAGGTPAPVPFNPPTAPTQVVDAGFPEGRTTVLAAQTGALTGTRALPPTTGPVPPMPPLHGTVDDDDDWPVHDAPPPAGGRRRWLWAVAALVVLLLVVGGGLLLTRGLGDDGDRSAAPTGTPTGSAQPGEGVALAPASAYVGRDADEVADELEALGLTVTQESAPDSLLAGLGLELDEGAVAAITPSGQTVPPETEVTLRVAEDGWTVEDDEPGEQPAPAPEPEEPSTAPTTTAAPTTTTAPTSSAPTTSTAPTTTPPTTTLPGQPGEEPPPSPPADGGGGGGGGTGAPGPGTGGTQPGAAAAGVAE
ncbi:serine/threonine-protein kinase [Blastococcus sp. TML/M2B]|uniref:serine/threonine-protein kinase n=1 Tax=Blastococcus sp. TML/M2B TaxID=2798727 RepID=UPI00190CCA3D|nr:serine/threonine-protein kinase [Blastococcus sp. TML/M2B]MBN1094455.1 serine/threonine-protein kinase [Blastococcus sp. TML/M2B]